MTTATATATERATTRRVPLNKPTAKLLEPMRFSKRDHMHVALNDDASRLRLSIYELSDDNKRGWASTIARYDFPERFPEKHRINAGTPWDQWEVAATDVSAEIINCVWPANRLECDEDARQVLDYLLLTNAQLDSNAERYAEFKEYQRLTAMYPAWKESGWYGESFNPPDTLGLEVNESKPLKLYQQVALANCYASEGYCLGMEQGTGKTPVIIAEICNDALRHRVPGRLYKVIVVTPNNVRLNWQSEFATFATQPGKVTVLRGSDVERVKLLVDAMRVEDDCLYTVVVCSYDCLCNSWDSLKLCDWDMAVLDEAHYIKSPQTRRFKYATQLRDVSKKRRALTGTPITNTALDMYSIWEFLGKGWSGFNTWKNFREFYGHWRATESGHRALIGLQNLPFMQERMARTMYIVSKAEVMPELPDMVYDVVEVEMTPSQAEAYEKLATHLYWEIEQDLDRAERTGSNKSVTINNVLTKLLRLAQVTSGFIKYDDKLAEDGESMSRGVVEAFTPNPKIDALVELLREKTPNDKTIVWACWVADIRAIAARLEDEGIDAVTFYGSTSEEGRKEAEHRFNYDTDCRVFIGNPAAGGTGLNLLGYPPHDGEAYETNCNHEIYFSQNWSPTARSQSEARAHRRGTRENVRVTDLCVPNTVDEQIRARVMQKRAMAMTVSDLRELLADVLKRPSSKR